MTLRIVLFIFRLHSPRMQKRLLEDFLKELGLSRGQAREAASHMR